MAKRKKNSSHKRDRMGRFVRMAGRKTKRKKSKKRRGRKKRRGGRKKRSKNMKATILQLLKCGNKSK